MSGPLSFHVGDTGTGYLSPRIGEIGILALYLRMGAPVKAEGVGIEGTVEITITSLAFAGARRFL
jgi:hypothetical protein